MNIKFSYSFNKYKLQGGKLKLLNTKGSQAHKLFPSLSVAKLFIAAAFLSEFPKTRKYRALVKSMLTVIDNNAAEIIVEKLTREKFEGYLSRWGMKETTIYNPEKQIASTTTARDTVKFLRMLLNDNLKLEKENKDFIMQCMLESGPRVLEYPDNYLLYQKTGEALSIRKNHTAFNIVGILVNHKVENIIIFSMLSRCNGFWNRSRQLRFLDNKFKIIVSNLD